MNQNRLIILTGVSGIGLGDIGDRLVAALGQGWVHIPFEANLHRAAAKVFGSDYRDDWSTVEVLNHSEPLLEKLWRGCLDALEDDLSAAAANNSVLLTMHASWYSPDSTSVTSCIDYRRLANLGYHADTVVNVIDDIYDIYLALSEIGQIFYSGSPTLTRSTVSFPLLGDAKSEGVGSEV